MILIMVGLLSGTLSPIAQPTRLENVLTSNHISNEVRVNQTAKCGFLIFSVYNPNMFLFRALELSFLLLKTHT